MKRTYSTLILSIRCSITLFFIFSVLSVWSQDQKYHRIEAALSRWELPALMDDGLEVDHFDLRDGRFVAEVSESDLEVLKRNNVKFKITLRNLGKNLPKHNRKIDKAYAKGKSALSTQAILTPSNFALGSMGGFFTLDEINDELDEMHDAFPNLITIKSSIGTSIENRDIYMVKISDNPTVDEPEIEVFLNALHHAREPIGASQLIFFMWHILENYDSDPEVRTLVDNMELYFVPAVNPDGYVYNEFTNPNGGGFWRKNRRLNSNGSYGIDLNRNYGHEWGLDNVGSSGNPNSQTYRGTGPFSEPETRAIRDFVNEHEFIAALNYHSFGNLLIYPWGYRQSFVTPDNSTYRAMSTYMTEENNYTFGTGDETVGYVTNGDSDDWMYGEQVSKPKILSMTPEVGSGSDGFWPASSRIIPLCIESFPLNMKLMQIVATYARVTPESTNISNLLLNGSIPFDIKRFSINPATWTVSVSSPSPFVKDIGEAISFDNLDFLASETGDITYTLDENTPSGESILFALTVDNGTWSVTETVTVTYMGTADGTCPVPTELAVNAVTASSASLSWKQIDGIEGYALRYRQTGTTDWELLTTTTSSFTLSSLTQQSEYEVQVRTNCTDTLFSEYTSSVTFTTPGVAYCSSSSNTTSDEYISRVQLGTLNNVSAGGSGYSDFRNISTQLALGSTQTISVSVTWTGTVYREAYAAWIDYNRDGDFSDPGENVWNRSRTTASTVSGSFTVPASVTPGATVMRVSMKYNAIPGPCETFTYGEVEDYTVVLTNTPSVTIASQNSITSEAPLSDVTNSAVSPMEASEKVSPSATISVFPNPVGNVLKIATTKSQGTAASYVIYDVKGEVIQSGSMKGDVDASRLPKGAYSIRIGNNVPVKFLKE